jgi:hypothetical protein
MSPIVCLLPMVDYSCYNWVRIAANCYFQRPCLFSMSHRGHHTCGMIKSPLECLKVQSNGFTDVVILDSFTSGLPEPDEDRLWAHLLVEAWVTLQEKGELLGLSCEKPTVEELMGRIKFHRPRVRTTYSFYNVRAMLILFCRCSSNKTHLTAGCMSFETFTLPCITGRRHRRSW